MKIQITHRDGPARKGTVTNEEISFQIPAILHVFNQEKKFNDKKTSPILQVGRSVFSPKSVQKNPRVFSVDNFLSLPADMPLESYKVAEKLVSRNQEIAIIPSDLLYIQQKRFNEDTSLAIVSYASQLLRQQTYATQFLTTLRNRIPVHTLLYLPGVATPSNLALLCYLGVDLFDLDRALVAGLHQNFLFSEGIYSQKNLFSNPCMCPACRSKDVQDMTKLDIQNHNNFMLFSEIKHVRNAIQGYRLRELVEIRVRANPQLAAMLHLLDVYHYDYLEQATPIYRTVGIQATTLDALWRPEVQRFQRRVCTGYEKPLSSKVLLLLPCSAKKPYSRSKSHKRMYSFIGKLKNYRSIHEMIVTSPIGIVPRELESIYPASSYDIGVSGLWNKDEQHLIRSLFNNYLKRNEYDHIIVHLPKKMQDFLIDMFPSYSISCVDSPTSEESLNKLVEIISEKCQRYPSISIGQYRWERVRSLLTFQFGINLADRLLANCIVRGRGPQYKLLREDQQIGMISIPRGFVSLTMQGAEILYQADKYWVKIDKTFRLKGSVFAPGVVDADEGIRIGDEVCIVQNGHVEGVGVAQMPGKEMVSARYGEAVKLRHHAII